MTTVLAILQSAAQGIGISVPATYNENPKLLEILYSVSREIRASRSFPQQKRTHSFSTAIGTAEYAFPVDFYAPLLETQYDQGRHWQLIGPISDEEWNYILYAPGGASSNIQYRIFGPSLAQYSTAKMMKFTPTPSDVRTISFDYITTSMFYPASWTPGTTVYETVAADTYVSMFDDDIIISGLKYYYKESRGVEFDKDQKDFNRKLGNARARWIGSFRGTFGGAPVIRRYRPSTPGSWSF